MFSKSDRLYKKFFVEKDTKDCNDIVELSYKELRFLFNNGKREGTLDYYGINKVTDKAIKCAQDRLKKDYIKLTLDKEKHGRVYVKYEGN